MRRLSLILVASLLIAAAIPAPAAAEARLQQRAYALFVLPEQSGTYRAFFVSVHSNDGGATTSFSIYRGGCFGRATIENCYVSDRGISGALGAGDVFEFDPALGAARLEVTHKGVTHSATWEGTASVTPVLRPYDCLSPAGPAAGIARMATARGTLFGKTVRTPDADAGALEIIAYTC